MPSRRSRHSSAVDSAVGSRLGAVTGPDATADLWFAWVGDHVAEVDSFAERFLSPEEIGHRNAYRSRAAAERFVVTRSLVRTVLSAILDIPPRELRVSRTDLGKPIVSGGVHFNVTHSGNLVLLAVCGQRDVGVDVERRREVARVPALVARWLTLAERRDYEDMVQRGVDVSDAFLRIWSVKEARLKALGVGIAGAAGAAPRDSAVLRLDDFLDRLVDPHHQQRYVGAIAFA
jgi:phosphopantetheinyl transferase